MVRVVSPSKTEYLCVVIQWLCPIQLEQATLRLFDDEKTRPSPQDFMAIYRGNLQVREQWLQVYYNLTEHYGPIQSGLAAIYGTELPSWCQRHEWVFPKFFEAPLKRTKNHRATLTVPTTPRTVRSGSDASVWPKTSSVLPRQREHTLGNFLPLFKAQGCICCPNCCSTTEERKTAT